MTHLDDIRNGLKSEARFHLDRHAHENGMAQAQTASRYFAPMRSQHAPLRHKFLWDFPQQNHPQGSKDPRLIFSIFPTARCSTYLESRP